MDGRPLGWEPVDCIFPVRVVVRERSALPLRQEERKHEGRHELYIAELGRRPTADTKMPVAAAAVVEVAEKRNCRSTAGATRGKLRD